MGRNGVTHEDVAKAAASLTAEGKSPTIENVRLITRMGSSTTIARHLKAWKENALQTKRLLNKNELPEAMMATIQGLWTGLVNQAEEKIAVISTAFEQQLQSLTAEQNQLQTQHHHLAQKHHHLQQAHGVLLSEKNHLERAIQQLEQEKCELGFQHEHQTTQLAEKDERILELQQLNRQVQANLEHYREASREQRLQDQAHFDQFKAESENAVKLLQQTLTLSNEEKQRILLVRTQLETTNDNLRAQNTDLNQKMETLTREYHQIKQDLLCQAQAKMRVESDHQAAQQKNEQQALLIAKLTTEGAVMAQKLVDIGTALQDSQDQNKLLASEKWVLGQEKAQLMGALKQLDETQS